MVRGIRFMVPNVRYPIILIVRNIEIKKYFWVIVEEEVYDNEMNNFLKKINILVKFF